MAIKVRGDASGTIAIYTHGDDAPADDLPFSNPLAHLSRLRFHSSLNTPRIISTITTSITLPARTNNSAWNVKHVLAAHGRPGIPMILGKITNLGGASGVTMAGSVPLDATASVAGLQNLGLYRWVTLGADASNIVLHENTDVPSGSVAGAAVSVTLNLTVEVFDLLMDGAAPGPGADSKLFSMSPTLFTARRGAFRSDSKYLRASESAAYLMPLSKTADIAPNANTTTAASTHIRYAVGAYSKNNDGNPSSFSATTQGVRK